MISTESMTDQTVTLIPIPKPRVRIATIVNIGVLTRDRRAANLFDQETANRLRTEILEVSGSKDYMEMWVAFRGREPEIDPMLRDLGLQ